jgi:hypothetical protein
MALGNPMGVPPEADFFAAPPRDASANWNETAFFSVWSPETAVGVWAHIGRCRGDLDLWWAHAAALLPDGRLASSHSWGRSTDPRCASTGNLFFTVVDPHQRWSVVFDGAAEMTTSAAALERLLGSGPHLPMRWNIDATAASPVWDLYHGKSGDNQDWAGDSHTQQTFNVRGSIIVGAEAFRVDGVGYNDHSRGVRDLTRFGADQWFIGRFQDHALHLIDIFDASGQHVLHSGGISTAEGFRPATARLLPDPDETGAPRRFDLMIDSGGETRVLHAEVLHLLPITITDANENLNGTGWELPGDPLFFSESVIKLSDAEGRVGYANREMARRRTCAKTRKGQGQGVS